jgi:hypothetical protein
MEDLDQLAKIAYETPEMQESLRSIIKRMAFGDSDMSYDDLGDAALVTGDDRYGKKTSTIWYVKRKYVRDFNMGAGWVREHNPELVPTNEADLSRTHVMLGHVGERNLDEIFEMMQGFKWSPNGEANDLIRSKGLTHTSMSVGDIIQRGSKLFMVDSTGFSALT